MHRDGHFIGYTHLLKNKVGKVWNDGHWLTLDLKTYRRRNCLVLQYTTFASANLRESHNLAAKSWAGNPPDFVLKPP